MPFDQDHNASPFNDVPPVVVIGALVLVAIEIVLELAQQGVIGGAGGVGWRSEAIGRFSFWAPQFDWMMLDSGRWQIGIIQRLVTYPFIHGGFTHMMFGVVILLALGKFVGQVFSGLALVALWFGSAIAGALALLLLTDTQIPLFGAMPPDYGLVGAFTFLLWRKAKQTGEHPARAFRMIGVLIGLQLMFALMQGGIGVQVIAELAGFAAGFLLCFLLAPGAWAAIRARLRNR
ncbi:rhomboid family intramembrane serine protease [Frigidibacter sp. ROC022]|uniref:rhomboid family intramembrane serine protease n=1 Tax=Frigidibacter sp. ROC022 TaxID=2971796 RepID=UPI00215A7E03|nr:rhomboid family intramembrane serine protease [Frigidibacter sp. ROC022]MCR8724027.1 rhomboid family intramembrane serine protease [Frigidibacter sp. ROC022]